MRAFVAVMLPDAVRRGLAPYVDQLRDLDDTLTWESPDRWHITLTFLGDVDESTIEGLGPRLVRAGSRTEPFTLSLCGVGRVGSRVLHAKVDGNRASLRRLAERTSAAARREGVPLDDRRYHPHLTLARSRHGADLRPLVSAGEGVHAEWRVTDVVLIRSVLGHDRRYDVLATYPLKRSNDA